MPNNFISHHYASECKNGVNVWHVPKLWRLGRLRPIKPILVDSIIASIIDEANEHYNEEDWDKVFNARLRYPIILDQQQNVVDGIHRLIHAYLNGIREVRSVTIYMPSPDYVFKTWEEYDAWFDSNFL